jgi:hypothetical protein
VLPSVLKYSMFPPSNASDMEQQQFDKNKDEDLIALDFIDAELLPPPILLVVETKDNEETNLDVQNNDEDKNDATISIEYFKAVRMDLLKIVLELGILVVGNR